MTIEQLQEQNLKLIADLEGRDKTIQTLQETITSKDTIIETSKTELETNKNKITELQTTNLELYKKVAVGVVPPIENPKPPEEKKYTVNDLISSL